MTTYIPQNPILDERDVIARRLWDEHRLIKFDYLWTVLGDPSTTVSTAQRRPFLTEKELARTPSPFGPEPDWE